MFLLCHFTVCGQNIVADFCSSLRGKRSVFDYSFVVKGDFPLSGSGQLVIQDDAFVMTGDGLKIYCDGTTRWTVDTAAQECYIENVEGSADYEANPALLLSVVDKEFSLIKTYTQTWKGRKMTAALMEPKLKGGSLSQAVLYFDGKSLQTISVTVHDGTETEISISGLKSSEPQSGKSYSFDSSKLPKDYIVTDLR